MAKTAVKLIEVLNSPLGAVDPDVTEALWSGDLADDEREHLGRYWRGLPASSSPQKTLSDLITALRICAKEDSSASDSSSNKLWSELAKRDISARTFVAMLYFVMTEPPGRAVTPQESILAAVCYVALLRVPGSTAVVSFHPLIFRTVLNVVVRGLPYQAAAPPKSKKHSSTAPKPAAAAHDEDDLAVNMEDSNTSTEDAQAETEEGSLASHPTDTVPLIEQLLRDLLAFLNGFSLRTQHDSLAYTIEVMAELTRAVTSDPSVGKSDRSSTKRRHEASIGSTDSDIGLLAYAVLDMLLRPPHSNKPQRDRTLPLVLKNLMPNLLMTSADSAHVSAVAPPKHLLAVRSRALDFIRQLVDKYAAADGDALADEPTNAVMRQAADDGDSEGGDNREEPQRGEREDSDGEAADDVSLGDIREGGEAEELRVAGLYPSLHALLQQFCVRAADKSAHFRTHGCDVITALLSMLPTAEQPRFSVFLGRLSRNKKVGFRLFAVDVAYAILHQNATIRQHDEDEDVYDRTQAIDVQSLVDILVKRSSDKATGVRSKALSNLAQILQEVQSADHRSPLRLAIDQLFAGDTPTNAAAGGSPPSTASDLMTLLRRRLTDEKSSVRRAALQALDIVATSFAHGRILPTTDMQALLACCVDASVAIRKQAAVSLTHLVQAYPTEVTVCRSWLEGVLPMIADPEATVQEKCIDAIDEVLLGRVAKDSDGHVWALVRLIDGDLLKYVQQACMVLSKQKRLPKPLVGALQRAVRDGGRREAWLLLAEISQYCAGHIDTAFVLKAWAEVRPSLFEDESRHAEVQRILQVVHNVAGHIREDAATRLADELLEHLQSFALPPGLIQCHVQALAQLCRCHAQNTRDAERLVDAWARRLLAQCDMHISAYVLPLTSSPPQSQPAEAAAVQSPGDTVPPTAGEMICYLFTLGEVAQVCPSAVPKRLVTVVQALVSAGADTAVGGPQVPAAVRAYAFVALGKLCLEDESLAKRCIAALARELDRSESAIIRNNVMVILCDLCIKYTALVDLYIPNLAMCLRDPSELVRRQTLILLTNLLQEDYVKWKGPLFYPFVIALVDESPAVRQYAQYCLFHLSTTKKSAMFFTHFVETLFHLNDYRDHPVYNQFARSEKERTLFALKGNGDNRRLRHAIYKILLGGMTDEQKLHTTAKLCQDVLGGVVDNIMELSNPATADLLADALAILSSKEIKISPPPKTNGSAGDEAEDAENAMSAAKGKLLSKIVKKNTIENIVPIVIELKHLLEKHHSPLLGHLMAYLQHLMKDYKDEVSEIMAADKRLAKEIDYDLRQYNQRVQQQRRQSLAAPSPAVAAAASPAVPPQRRLMSPMPQSPAPDPAGFAVPRLRRQSVLGIRNAERRRRSIAASGATSLSSAEVSSPAVVATTPSPAVASRRRVMAVPSPYTPSASAPKVPTQTEGSVHVVIRIPPEPNSPTVWSVEADKENRKGKKRKRPAEVEAPSKADSDHHDDRQDEEVPEPPPARRRRTRSTSRVAK